jgi:hypothetical protein
MALTGDSSSGATQCIAPSRAPMAGVVGTTFDWRMRVNRTRRSKWRWGTPLNSWR